MKWDPHGSLGLHPASSRGAVAGRRLLLKLLEGCDFSEQRPGLFKSLFF